MEMLLRQHPEALPPPVSLQTCLEDAWERKTVPNLWPTMGGECEDLPPLLAVLQIYMLHLWIGDKSQMSFLLFLVVRSSWKRGKSELHSLELSAVGEGGGAGVIKLRLRYNLTNVRLLLIWADRSFTPFSWSCCPDDGCASLSFPGPCFPPVFWGWDFSPPLKGCFLEQKKTRQG